jgi:hypothetical protein
MAQSQTAPQTQDTQTAPSPYGDWAPVINVIAEIFSRKSVAEIADNPAASPTLKHYYKDWTAGDIVWVMNNTTNGHFGMERMYRYANLKSPATAEEKQQQSDARRSMEFLSSDGTWETFSRTLQTALKSDPKHPYNKEFDTEKYLQPAPQQQEPKPSTYSKMRAAAISNTAPQTYPGLDQLQLASLNNVRMATNEADHHAVARPLVETKQAALYAQAKQSALTAA